MPKRKAFSINGEILTLDERARSAAPGKFIKLSKGFTHYELEGPQDGEPVALASGFSIPYYLWDHTFPALVRAGFRVLRFDYFGRGLSDRPDLNYGPDLFDQQLLELLESLGMGGPINIIGSSMGGVVSANFTARHPEMVKKLVLIDPAGMMPRPSFPASALNIPIIGEIMLDLFGNQLLVQGNAKDMLHPEAFPEYTTLYQPQMTYSGFRRAVLSTFRDGMLHSKGEAYQRVGKLALPILIVWGKEDQVIPLSISDWFQKTLPNAVFKIIEQAGHVPQYELPDVVNPILIDFIRADTFQS